MMNKLISGRKLKAQIGRNLLPFPFILSPLSFYLSPLSFCLSPFIFLLLLSSCNPDSHSSRQTVFNINLDEGLTSLDPAFCRNQNTIWMDNQLYNGLVQINDSLKTIPCIAKTWDISTDGKTYTFHLRNDVYFHDDAHFKNGI